MDQDGTWHGGAPWSRPHCDRWRPSYQKKAGAPPQFSAHVYCGQTAGWIKMPLGTEVGLGSNDIVLVHGQVTIIFVVCVCLFVSLSVCAEFFSAVFDPISIKLGYMLYVWV